MMHQRTSWTLVDLQFSVMKDCENKEAAYEVLNFLLKDENVQSYLDEQKAVLCKEGDFWTCFNTWWSEIFHRRRKNGRLPGSLLSFRDVSRCNRFRHFFMKGDVDAFLTKFDTDWRDITVISSAKWKITRKSMWTKIKEGEFKHGERNQWVEENVTFLLITIRSWHCFFCFNTLPLDQKVWFYSFT